MKITPMDVARQDFSRRFRGLDPDEVRGYLTLVAEELAAVERERATLDQQVKHMEGLLDEHRQREGILKSTLLTAQKASDDIREAANRQAHANVKEAELQADKLLELAQGRAHAVEGGILELRALRTALRTDIRGFVTRLTSLLDLQEEAELEDNLRFLKRREETGTR
jgi:cell division initiation protein